MGVKPSGPRVPGGASSGARSGEAERPMAAQGGVFLAGSSQRATEIVCEDSDSPRPEGGNSYRSCELEITSPTRTGVTCAASMPDRWMRTRRTFAVHPR